MGWDHISTLRGKYNKGKECDMACPTFKEYVENNGNANNNICDNGKSNDNSYDTKDDGPNNNTGDNSRNISRNDKSNNMGNNCRNINADLNNSNFKDDVNVEQVRGTS